MKIFSKIQNFDTKIAFYMTKFYHHKWLNKIMMFISSCGDFGMSWLVVILITNLNPSTQSMSIDMLIALLAATIIGQVTIKTFVKRERPCHTYKEVEILVPIPSDYSFPSGHTTSSFACSVVMFLYNPVLGLFGFSYAFLTAISRMYLFVHYPSDVIFGMILGNIIGFLVFLI